MILKCGMNSILLRPSLTLVLATVIASLAFTGTARADQGNMRAALEHLRQARASLQAASRDKGGHRTEAVRLIDQAIEQVKEGIAVGEEHE